MTHTECTLPVRFDAEVGQTSASLEFVELQEVKETSAAAPSDRAQRGPASGCLRAGFVLVTHKGVICARKRDAVTSVGVKLRRWLGCGLSNESTVTLDDM